MMYGLIANPKVRNVRSIAQRVLNILGDDVLLEKDVARIVGRTGQEIEQMNVEILITIGGDGTILKAFQHNKAAVAGINAGLVGFLTSIDLPEVEDKIARIMDGQYNIEERIKLKIDLNDKRLEDCTNEAVIHTSHTSKMRHFEIYVDGDLAIDLRADGIIVSTPTGSTCYSMSVGGPIIDPGVQAFVISPIAPFKLYARPIVVPAASDIEIRLKDDRDCVLVLDGQNEYRVGPDDVVKYSLSENRARFVKFGKGFYKRCWENLAKS